MANLLSGLTDKILSEVKESTATGGLLPTDVYTVAFKAPFISANANGTVFVQLDVQVLVNPATKQIKELTHKEWISFSGGKFVNANGKTMRGLAVINGLAQLAGYNSLTEVPTEVKNVKIRKGKEEVVEACDVLVGLRGKKFKAAISHVRKNKQAKNNQTGTWDDINEAIEINEVFKFFDASTNQMSSEKADNREAAFMQTWLEANKGKVRDIYKEVAGAGTVSGVNAPKQGNPAEPNVATDDDDVAFV